VLVASGLQETIAYMMTAPEREASLTPATAAVVAARPYVIVANPIRPDRAVLRQSLLASALENLANNARYRERLALFEIGPVFLPVAGELLPHEQRRLSIALSGPRHAPGWDGGDAAAFDFFDLKGIVDTLLARLGLQAAWTPERENPTFHPGRTAVVSLPSGRSLGIVGELHPLARDAFNAQGSADLPATPILLADLDFQALVDEAVATPQHVLLPTRPPVKMDLAVIVDEAVTQADVRRVIVGAGGELLRALSLFDVYRGPQIGAGRKSLAYALTFQAADRTLSDDDIAPLVQRIIERLGVEVGGTIRS